jgi:hypothetical protein
MGRSLRSFFYEKTIEHFCAVSFILDRIHHGGLFMNQQLIGMPELFSELGLDSDHADIALFIQRHSLLPGVLLVEASFWTPAQREFLRESGQQDSDWYGLVHQLDKMLRKPAVKH